MIVGKCLYISKKNRKLGFDNNYIFYSNMNYNFSEIFS